MILEIKHIPMLYKKFLIEIKDNGAVHTKIVSEKEKKEIKCDLKGIATIIEL